ncbi:MAG: hypothetical protein ACI8UD_002730 [Planctomycetota bacterium]|jgi:hypothetical protein
MKRLHRKAHVLMWALLGPIAMVGLIVAVNARVVIPTQAPPVQQDVPQTMPPAKEVAPK